MRNFISSHRKLWIGAAVAIFWIAVWQLMSLFLSKVLFAGPAQTVQSLFALLGDSVFWLSIGHSLAKITAGFALAFVCGCVVAVGCHRFTWLDTLLAPAIQLMKSVPIACFTVVALIWIGSANISVLVAFFVVFPVTCINLMTGLRHIDREMLEMAQVFRVPFGKRLRYLYVPQVMPYVLAGCRVTVGMAWKAGIAGEIIGLPRASIGEQLYLSKLYLNTADLFAWTITIIVVSLACERAVLMALSYAQKKGEAYHGNSL